MMKILTRQYHTIRPNYRKLQHIHFPGISSFQHGLNIQQSLVDANLNYKSLEFKYRRIQRQQQQQLQQQPQSQPQQPFTNSKDTSLLDLKNKIEKLQPLPTILTFEFDNVYAGGLRLKSEVSTDDLEGFKRIGGQYYQLERGGQVTWHGKGQLVAYLILDLKNFVQLTTKCYINNVLLKSIQNVLKKSYNLDSVIGVENPGIWIEDNKSILLLSESLKISSVGVRIRHGITEYGIALNINPDLKYLNTFEMCGLKNKRATSIHEQLDHNHLEIPSVEHVGKLFVDEVALALEMDSVEYINADSL